MAYLAVALQYEGCRQNQGRFLVPYSVGTMLSSHTVRRPYKMMSVLIQVFK